MGLCTVCACVRPEIWRWCNSFEPLSHYVRSNRCIAYAHTIRPSARRRDNEKVNQKSPPKLCTLHRNCEHVAARHLREHTQKRRPTATASGCPQWCDRLFFHGCQASGLIIERNASNRLVYSNRCKQSTATASVDIECWLHFSRTFHGLAPHRDSALRLTQIFPLLFGVAFFSLVLSITLRALSRICARLQVPMLLHVFSSSS